MVWVLIAAGVQRRARPSTRLRRAPHRGTPRSLSGSCCLLCRAWTWTRRSAQRRGWRRTCRLPSRRPPRRARPSCPPSCRKGARSCHSSPLQVSLPTFVPGRAEQQAPPPFVDARLSRGPGMSLAEAARAAARMMRELQERDQNLQVSHRSSAAPRLAEPPRTSSARRRPSESVPSRAPLIYKAPRRTAPPPATRGPLAPFPTAPRRGRRRWSPR